MNTEFGSFEHLARLTKPKKSEYKMPAIENMKAEALIFHKHCEKFIQEIKDLKWKEETKNVKPKDDYLLDEVDFILETMLDEDKEMRRL